MRREAANAARVRKRVFFSLSRRPRGRPYVRDTRSRRTAVPKLLFPSWRSPSCGCQKQQNRACDEGGYRLRTRSAQPERGIRACGKPEGAYDRQRQGRASHHSPSSRFGWCPPLPRNTRPSASTLSTWPRTMAYARRASTRKGAAPDRRTSRCATARCWILLDTGDLWMSKATASNRIRRV